jgi:hypothetical protein
MGSNSFFDLLDRVKNKIPTGRSTSLDYSLKLSASIDPSAQNKNILFIVVLDSYVRHLCRRRVSRAGSRRRAPSEPGPPGALGHAIDQVFRPLEAGDFPVERILRRSRSF